MTATPPRRGARRLASLLGERGRAWLHEVQEARRLAWTLDLVRRCDVGEAELAANRAALAEAAARTDPVLTVSWYLPLFDHAFYGGVHTILRFASGWLARHGMESTFIVYDAPRVRPEEVRRRIVAAFPELAQSRVLVLRPGDVAPSADAAIATLWTGAYLLVKDRAARRKLYFLQDDERLFHAAGTQSALAGATWRFGFPAIVNTPGLREVYARESGAPTFAFVPAVDPAVFHPPPQPRAGPFRVFFYGRPRTERNAFELGVSALARLVERRGREVEVVAAGAGVPRRIAARFPRIQFRGLLPYAETGDLYRRCDAGLALMMTRHPSYLPFELMACGAVPVAAVNPDNAWLLRHEENALVVEPTVSCLAGALERLLDDPPLRQRLAGEGTRTVARVRWDEQVDAAAAFLRRPVGDGGVVR